MALRFHHELLERVRVDLGLTQEEAARALRVDVRTYRRYESGEVNEGADFAVQRASRRKLFRRMSSELGVDEGELLVDAEAEGDARWRGGHVLPRAAHFVGRSALVADLRGWIAAPAPASRVRAIVAMGGAGKTTVVDRAIDGARAFVWSFYEDARIEVFLDACLEAVGAERGRGDPIERWTARVESGRSSIALFVLDGLESVQATGSRGRARGELEDPRLRLLLRRIARGAGAARSLVTTRVDLVDLAGEEGAGFERIGLEPLDEDEARALLRAFGARSTGSELRAAAERSGGHALSIAVMGSYAGAFLDGDLGALTSLDLREAAREDPLARRLERLFEGYGAALTPLDRDVLVRICLLPRGADLDALERLAKGEPIVAGALADVDRTRLRAAAGRLAKRGLIHVRRRSGGFDAHPIVREWFGRLAGGASERIHEAERRALGALLGERPASLPTSARELDLHEALLEHTLAAGEVEAAAAILHRSLGGFAHLGLRLGENARGLRMVRAFARGDGEGDPSRVDPRLSASLRRRLTYDWGLYESALGDLHAARRAYEASLEISEAMGDAIAIVVGARTLAYATRAMGELGAAHASLERSILLARATDARDEVVRGLALLGAVLTTEERYDDALERFAETRALGDVPVARRGIWEAECYVARGETATARRLLVANVLHCEALGWGGHAAHGRAILGLIAVGDGELHEAAGHLAALEAWADASGELEMRLLGYRLGAELAIARGAHEAAARSVASGLDVARAGGWRTLARELERLDERIHRSIAAGA